jgi:ferrous iron transport protein B
LKETPPIKQIKRVALIGNANLGKTTLFNSLCGLRQKTGNYPGVTIDKNKGYFKVGNREIALIDLPGINSMFPKSKDEELVADYLLDAQKEDFPDVLLVLANALNLKRSLYLLDQIRDLNLPTVLAINFSEMATKRGISIDVQKLQDEFEIPVVLLDAKSGVGLQDLKGKLLEYEQVKKRDNHFLTKEDAETLLIFQEEKGIENAYQAFLELLKSGKDTSASFVEKHQINIRNWKNNESILRYKFLSSIVDDCIEQDKSKATDFTSKADRILVHPIWGYVIFAFIMFTIFQSIFLLASYPMDWIDQAFTSFSTWISNVLPAGYFSDLIADGLIPGIGGVVIFIPQIAILFFLFSLLEESGYMQRIVFLMDRLMQWFGMSGKSVVPMISGLACAIPAIMSSRTIENKKERLITILITPLITCSARIPVYIVIIALIIPDDAFIGIFHVQGLVLMGMYLLGVVLSLMVALVLKLILKNKYKSYLLIEMPEYLKPQLKTVFISVRNNVRSFVWNAGKIILATSIILFVLATNGGEKFNHAEENITLYDGPSQDDLQSAINTYKLENSYLGMMGKSIEPAIQPLGYDWKIGIALISSLAAREVFVGTLSTIYSINSDEELTIRDKLRKERSESGAVSFGFATCISLLLFYALSLQCLSTIAVTYKETKSIKWTSIQFAYMTILAYFAALMAYQLLS